MNKHIIELAEKNGFTLTMGVRPVIEDGKVRFVVPPGLTPYGEKLVAFAQAVAEECAKLVDAQLGNTSILYSDPPQSAAARDAAMAIRSQFEAGEFGALAAAMRAKFSADH